MPRIEFKVNWTMLKLDPLKGCDGKPHPCKFLAYKLEKAIKSEDYELCAIIRDEQKRRKEQGIVIEATPVSTKPDWRPPQEEF